MYVLFDGRLPEERKWVSLRSLPHPVTEQMFLLFLAWITGPAKDSRYVCMLKSCEFPLVQNILLDFIVLLDKKNCPHIYPMFGPIFDPPIYPICNFTCN